MMKNWFIISLLITSFMCVTCQKDVVESREYPRIRTLEVNNISSSGATFNAEILSLGTSPVIEYGFLWDTISNPNSQSSRSITLYEKKGTGEFMYRADASLDKGSEYYVKSFVRSEEYTSYGAVVQFVSSGSLAPKIESFEPNSANWGDTLSLRGKRFDTKNNIVFFGEIGADVSYNSDSLIKVIVPFEDNQEQVKVIIKTKDYTVSSDDFFEYKKAMISGFSPSHGTFGDTVTISGSEFPNNKSLKVSFAGIGAHLINSTSQRITVQVPPEANQKEIQLCVSVNVSEMCEQEYFVVDPPIIENVSSSEVNIGENIYLEGQNFNPISSNNKVLLGDKYAKIINATNDSIEVEIPDGVWDSREISVQVTTAEQESVFDSKLRIMDQWLNKGNIPIEGYMTTAVYNFSYQQYGYCAFISNNTIQTYRYDSSSNSWSEMGDFPGTYRSRMTAFVIDDYAYIGGFGDAQDFWRYDIVNNSWMQIADFPKSNDGMISFAGNSKGYVICTYEETNNFWQYNVVSDTWEKLGDFLPDNKWDTYADISFQLDNKGYVLTCNGNTSDDELWEYNMLTQEWKRLADQIDNLFYRNRSVFVIDNVAYLMPDAYYPYYCKYDIETNTWSIEGETEGRHNGVCFTIDDVAYIGGGSNFSNSLNDFWEYAPNP